MTPNEMFDYLNEMPAGVQFDMTYTNYLIKLRSTETGMSLLAKNKANNKQLIGYAAELYGADQQFLLELHNKHRSWGYSHH